MVEGTKTCQLRAEFIGLCSRCVKRISDTVELLFLRKYMHIVEHTNKIYPQWVASCVLKPIWSLISSCCMGVVGGEKCCSLIENG